MSESRLEDELKSETLKWLERIEKEVAKIVESNKNGFLENIDAYIKDTYYFLNKNDLIRAFECVIWAWAWLEIGLKIGLLKYKG